MFENLAIRKSRIGFAVNPTVSLQFTSHKHLKSFNGRNETIISPSAASRRTIITQF
jgi:hypothetical protein